MNKLNSRIIKILAVCMLLGIIIISISSTSYAANKGPSETHGSIYIDNGNSSSGYILNYSDKNNICKTFKGITYNKEKNTLYLQKATIKNELILNCMGDDLKIELIGTSHIGNIKINDENGTWACNYTVIGSGEIHKLIKTDIIPATFTSAGYTEDIYCSTCGYHAQYKRELPRIATCEIWNKYVGYTGENRTPKVDIEDLYGKILKKGIDYDVTYFNCVNVGSATAKVVFKGYYSGEKEIKYTITKGSLAPTWKLLVKNLNQGIELTWPAITKADIYIIRRKTSTSEYKVIKVINNNSVTKYVDTSVKNNNGKGYYYEIEAYKNENYYERKAANFCLRMLKPNVTYTKKKNNLILKWNKNYLATGYEILLVCGKSKKSYNVNGLGKTIKLTKGKTYKMYVRSYYKNYRNDYYYSEWTKGKSVKV